MFIQQDDAGVKYFSNRLQGDHCKEDSNNKIALRRPNIDVANDWNDWNSERAKKLVN